MLHAQKSMGYVSWEYGRSPDAKHVLVSIGFTRTSLARLERYDMRNQSQLSHSLPPPEPYVKINGWSLRLSTMVSAFAALAFIVSIAGVWYTMQANMAHFINQFDKFAEKVEKNQAERVSDIKALQEQVMRGREDSVRFAEQIGNLNLLISDTKQLLMRRIEQKDGFE